ncbi:FixH family protein [Lentibacillus sp. CBA3610]|uniref:FixH family protein n=1 Tax=Lentibacillus sp. CBA3610 TaxID=2518176 RepID=UPI00350E4C2C
MYAHTTAREMHTMPKKSITIGDGGSQESENGDESQDASGHEHGDHADGFSMDFAQSENVSSGKETDLTVQLQMDNEPLEEANVQYEITNDDLDIHEWAETDETEAGEYTGSYSFEEAGTYNMTIHVKNDDGLHEHEEHEIEVN